MNPIQRAVLIRRYGGAEVIEIAGIEKPVPGPGQVAAGVTGTGRGWRGYRTPSYCFRDR